MKDEKDESGWWFCKCEFSACLAVVNPNGRMPNVCCLSRDNIEIGWARAWETL